MGSRYRLLSHPANPVEIAVSSEKGKRKREGNHGWTQRGKPQPNDFNYGLTPMDTDFTEENRANGDVEMAAEDLGGLASLALNESAVEPV